MMDEGIKFIDQQRECDAAVRNEIERLTKQHMRDCLSRYHHGFHEFDGRTLRCECGMTDRQYLAGSLEERSEICPLKRS